MKEEYIVTIIISRCYATSYADDGWRITGDSIREDRKIFANNEKEQAAEEEKILSGLRSFLMPNSKLAIIVRPTWNDKGFSFHEWRSFDGEEFSRVDFVA